MDDVDFTDDEISQELADLGYNNIPLERFYQFKKELFDLIRHERVASQTSSSNSSVSHIDTDRALSSQHTSSAQTNCRDKENVIHCVPSLRPVTDDSRRPASATGGAGAGPQRRGCCDTDKLLKRKTFRPTDGQVSVSESFTCSDTSHSDVLSELGVELHRVHINDNVGRPRSAPPSHISRSSEHTACRQPTLYNLPEDYDGPKALIRPMSCDHIKKTDPVARHAAYRQCWQACRAPGEKQHKQLRWDVRERMLYHDQVIDKRRQRSYQPNTYVIPSDKKRKTLRWQIRADLAHGIKPPSVFD